MVLLEISLCSQNLQIFQKPYRLKKHLFIYSVSYVINESDGGSKESKRNFCFCSLCNFLQKRIKLFLFGCIRYPKSTNQLINTKCSCSSVISLESFSALKLSDLESFSSLEISDSEYSRALKLTRFGLESFWVLKFSFMGDLISK